MTSEAISDEPTQLPAEQPRALQLYELVAGAVVLTTLLGLWLLFFIVTPAFAGMYADFGDTNLPALTRMVLSPWYPGAITLFSTVLFGIGLFTRLRTKRGGRGWMTLAAAAPAPAAVLLIASCYLPIFQLASAVS